jgi:hypothetical protein
MNSPPTTLARLQCEIKFAQGIKLSPRRRVLHVGDVRACLEPLTLTN